MKIEILDDCRFNEILPFSVPDIDAVFDYTLEQAIDGAPFQDLVSSRISRRGNCGGFTVKITDRSDDTAPAWVTFNHKSGLMSIHPELSSQPLYQLSMTVSLTDYPEIHSTKFFDIRVSSCMPTETIINTNLNQVLSLDYYWGSAEEVISVPAFTQYNAESCELSFSYSAYWLDGEEQKQLPAEISFDPITRTIHVNKCNPM